MKFKFRYTLFLAGLIASLILGCSTLFAPRIQPDSMILPRGSRVLLAEAALRGLGYEIVPLRQTVSLPDITVINPAQTNDTAVSIHRLMEGIIAGHPVNMAFVLMPDAGVERGYAPYPFLKGWYKNTILEGGIYRTIEEPVYETRYKFTCTRTVYRVLQYDARGRLIGEQRIEPDIRRECPESLKENIHFDEYDPAIAWILMNLRVN